MSIKKSENLSQISHNQILDNKRADKISKIITYSDYLSLGYTKEKALEMSGLTQQDLNRNNG